MSFFQKLEFNPFGLLLLATFIFFVYSDMRDKYRYAIYLPLVSHDSILKTGTICTHSTLAQNPELFSIKKKIQKNLNEANISNIIEENSTLKFKLNAFRYDQVYFKENPKDILLYTGLPICGVLNNFLNLPKVPS